MRFGSRRPAGLMLVTGFITCSKCDRITTGVPVWLLADGEPLALQVTDLRGRLRQRLAKIVDLFFG
jgi:hypothetical protein